MTEADIERRLSKIDASFQEICSDPVVLKETVEKFFNVLVNELTLGIIFEVHRSYKRGTFDVEDSTQNDDDDDDDDPEMSENEPNSVQQQPINCTCPHCGRLVGAFRYASHLQGCMGLRRNKTRNASRRIATSSNSRESTSYSSIGSDDEDDAAWNAGAKKRKKKERNKRIPKAKTTPKKNGDTVTEANAEQSNYKTYDNMSEDEKRNLLNHICGVVTEHTKRICTRSLRCTQHTEEKRKALRNAIMSNSASPELLNVDIEGDEEEDSISLRDLLQDHSNNSSADSTSSSTASKKKEKMKVKSKAAKKEIAPCN